MIKNKHIYIYIKGSQTLIYTKTLFGNHTSGKKKKKPWMEFNLVVLLCSGGLRRVVQTNMASFGH